LTTNAGFFAGFGLETIYKLLSSQSGGRIQSNNVGKGLMA